MIATRYASGVNDSGPYVLGQGRLDRGTDERTGVVLMLGGGSTETYWTAGLVAEWMAQLCDEHNRRFIAVPANWDWGNSVVVERMRDAILTAQSRHAFAERVHLIGISMGGPCVANYAKHYPETVASMVLMIAAVDVQDIHDNDLSTPYGGSVVEPSEAFGDERPPDAWTSARNASAFVRIPTVSWYSNNDAICRVGPNEDFIANCRGTGHNLGDQFPSGFAIPGHTAENIPFDEVIAWIEEND